MNLAGSVAVVTGGASGLGAELSRALAQRGARVVIADRDTAAANRLAAELPGSAVVVTSDLGVDTDLVRLVERAAATGPVKVVVNNAGGWMSKSQFPVAASDDWGATLTVNLRTPMRVAQLALPTLIASGGGAIVNVASSAARGSDPYGCPEYAAAKAGLIRFTTATGRLGPAGEVRVAAVVSGWIGLPRAQAEYAALSAAEQQDSGGLIDPVLLAAVVVDLAADDDSGGVVLAVDADRPPYHLGGLA